MKRAHGSVEEEHEEHAAQDEDAGPAPDEEAEEEYAPAAELTPYAAPAERMYVSGDGDVYERLEPGPLMSAFRVTLTQDSRVAQYKAYRELCQNWLDQAIVCNGGFAGLSLVRTAHVTRVINAERRVAYGDITCVADRAQRGTGERECSASFTNYGVGVLGVAIFYMGRSSKAKRTDVVGTHGEGLKEAVVAMLRKAFEGIRVTIDMLTDMGPRRFRPYASARGNTRYRHGKLKRAARALGDFVVTVTGPRRYLTLPDIDAYVFHERADDIAVAGVGVIQPRTHDDEAAGGACVYVNRFFVARHTKLYHNVLFLGGEVAVSRDRDAVVEEQRRAAEVRLWEGALGSAEHERAALLFIEAISHDDAEERHVATSLAADARGALERVWYARVAPDDVREGRAVPVHAPIAQDVSALRALRLEAWHAPEALVRVLGARTPQNLYARACRRLRAGVMENWPADLAPLAASVIRESRRLFARDDLVVDVKIGAPPPGEATVDVCRGDEPGTWVLHERVLRAPDALFHAVCEVLYEAVLEERRVVSGDAAARELEHHVRRALFVPAAAPAAAAPAAADSEPDVAPGMVDDDDDAGVRGLPVPPHVPGVDRRTSALLRIRAMAHNALL